MGFFKEITSNVTKGIKDLTKDTFFDKNAMSDDEDDEQLFGKRNVKMHIKNNHKSEDYHEKENNSKNMVRDEIDNIINSLENMEDNKFLSEKKMVNSVESVTLAKPKKKPKLDNIDSKTTIAKNTIIAGNIASVGDLEIYGTVCGDVECKGRLVIGGVVSGNAIATNMYINTPKFEGDVCCEGCIEVAVGTVVIGSLTGTSAVISGAVKGEIDVEGGVVLDSSAVVKGNIKAKTVQIDNGAVLQGYCELTYAEVNIDDYFSEVNPDNAEQDNRILDSEPVQILEEVEESPERAAYLKEMEVNYNAYMQEINAQNATNDLVIPNDESVNIQENVYMNEADKVIEDTNIDTNTSEDILKEASNVDSILAGLEDANTTVYEENKAVDMVLNSEDVTSIKMENIASSDKSATSDNNNIDTNIADMVDAALSDMEDTKDITNNIISSGMESIIVNNKKSNSYKPSNMSEGIFSGINNSSMNTTSAYSAGSYSDKQSFRGYGLY